MPSVRKLRQVGDEARRKISQRCGQLAVRRAGAERRDADLEDDQGHRDREEPVAQRPDPLDAAVRDLVVDDRHPDLPPDLAIEYRIGRRMVGEWRHARTPGRASARSRRRPRAARRPPAGPRRRRPRRAAGSARRRRVVATRDRPASDRCRAGGLARPARPARDRGPSRTGRGSSRGRGRARPARTSSRCSRPTRSSGRERSRSSTRSDPTAGRAAAPMTPTATSTWPA